MQERNKAKSVSGKSKLLLIAGFLFFVNPVPFGFDIIPDVFGCALLFFGLTQLAFFDGSVEEARKSLIYLFAVEAVHLLMMRSVLLTDIASNRMLAVTGFTIVQSILYIIFFKKLFSGISYLAMRRNCNQTLAKCDNTAFLSYLAFFVRLGATLIPELLAILELELSTELDFATIDMINAIIAAKPIVVLLFSLIALGTSIAWIISAIKLLKLLHTEAGTELDREYCTEYTSRPEKVRPKRVKLGCYVIYFALFFALDITFDGIRIIPASAMFLFLFAAALAFKEISEFKHTKRLAIPAFLLVLGTEIHRAMLVPDGAVIIYETELSTVVSAAVLGIAAATVALLCIKGFLCDVSKLSADLGGNEFPTPIHYTVYSITAVLWTAGFVIPYFHSATATPRLLASCVFIWLTVRTVGRVNEEEQERSSYYS